MLSENPYRCRLCLKVSMEVINIFREDFSKMIKLLTTIEVKPNDDLPKISCISCTKKVKEAMLIRRQIIRSHKTLLEEERVKKSKSSTLSVSSDNLNDNLYETNDAEEKNVNEFIFIEVNDDLNQKEKDDVIFVGSSKIEPVIIKEEHAKIQDLQDSLCKNGISILKVNKETCATSIKSEPGLAEKCATSIKCEPGLANIERTQIISRKTKAKPTLNPRTRVPSQRIVKLGLKPVTIVQPKLEPKQNLPKPRIPKPRIRNSTYDPLDRLPCKICQKLIQKSNIKQHEETHDKKTVTCHICGKVVKSTGLRFHIFYFHKCKENQFVCEQCGRHFRYRNKFNLHIKKAHGGTRDHKCNICGKSFFEKLSLTKHIDMKHNKLRPHICEYCGKGFSGRHALRTHVRQHTNEAPYQCSICGEGFRQRVSLKGHLKTRHEIEEENKVFCDACGKGFASDVALEVHARLHAEIKCPWCSDTFAEKQYLEQHVLTSHPDAIEDKNVVDDRGLGEVDAFVDYNKSGYSEEYSQ